MERNRKTRKKPEDYPIMAIRVSEEVKKELTAMIEKVQSSYNRALKDEHVKYKKNDIVIEALRRGLRQMK